MLAPLDLPDRFQKWIEVCITTTKFSISINGSLHGNVPSAKGLRLGDPLSPYLFILVVEFFFENSAFSYHSWVSFLSILNATIWGLCIFVVLMIFSSYTLLITHLFISCKMFRLSSISSLVSSLIEVKVSLFWWYSRES